MIKTLLVTGGAGFIGANFVLSALKDPGVRIVNLDNLTYAGNLENLTSIANNPRHIFVEGDICSRPLVAELLNAHSVDAILNFAAESHVDRSIDGPDAFVRTNINGTFELLEAARAYCRAHSDRADRFRFLHVSTDEVYGSLGEAGAFVETSRYAPNSPYAASKASADMIVRAYHETYKLPTLTTNCSNNYGAYQFPEKLIPLMILNALEEKPLPVYGDGGNVRDWLFVTDHCDAIRCVLEKGRVGEQYNIGGRSERTNVQIVKIICALLDEIRPRKQGRYSDLITFVKDRPGHDRRYAIDPSKIERDLGWSAKHRFEDAIRTTVEWYLKHGDWCNSITTGKYRRERLGV